jgi:parallel beta-helix repeat protein
MKIFSLLLASLACIFHAVADETSKFALGSLTNTSATYYVSASGNDNNPGTIESPFKTIQKAVDLATAGTTIYVREGTYVEVVSIHGKKGVPPAPIRLLAYPGETPVIDGQRTIPSNEFAGLLSIDNSEYIEVNGFNISNSAGRGVYARNGTQIKLLNNYIDYSERMGITIKTNHSLIENNHIYQCGQTNYGGKARAEEHRSWPGILMVDRTHDVTVRGNIVSHSWGEGIIDLISENTIIEDNIVWNAYALGIYLDNSAHSKVRRNLIYFDNDSLYWRSIRDYRISGTTPAIGIQIGNEKYSDNTTAKGIAQEITNNLVYNARVGFAFHFYDLADTRLTDVLIANNTFVDTHLEPIQIAAARNGHKNSNTRIVNNIFVRRDDGALAWAGSMEGLTFSHNLWAQSVPTQFSSPDDIVGDPHLFRTGGFTTTGELEPEFFALQSSSPAINKGLSLTEVTDDFFGNPRNGSPDIGGLEFDPATSIIQPRINKLNNVFKIYPNPNNSNLLRLSKEVDVTIYTLSGKEVLRSVGSSQIDISGLKNGIYIIRDIDGNVRKLVKQ